MVRNIFVKIRQNQKKFEHTVALIGIGLSGAFFQILHDHQSIREQPFESFRIDQAARATALQSLIGADEGFVQKVVEAELLACEGKRNRVGTRVALAGD